jgi:multiple sugar transport system substrate-binding protein
MAIIAGICITTGKADAANAALLIDYLTQPVIQARTMGATGFLPVVTLGKDTAIPEYLEALKSAVDAQTNDGKSVPTLAPQGLGEKGTDYNSIFMLTFSEIVLEDGDIATALSANAAELQAILDGAKARCWLPDVSEKRPCQIE